MRELLKEIESASRTHAISLGDGDWIASIPSTPGWYVLATDAPWKTLRTLVPQEVARGHYRIGDRTARAEELAALGVLIGERPGHIVPVYNGHAKKLRERAREHWNGHARTGCLSLRQYAELHGYRWEFRFTQVSDLRSQPSDSSALRNIGEQLWRAEHGWPILCIE
jgi:hypothetical protein